MQLELVLEAPPEAVQALWEQFDPAQREALIQRLVLLIAKDRGRGAARSGARR